MTNINHAPFSARLDRKILAAALKVLAKVVEKRNTIPIMSCVLLVPGRDSVTVRGSDLDIFASIEIPAVCQPGAAVAVDGDALKKAVDKGKADYVDVADVGGERVTFRDGDAGATLRFPARAASDFPSLVMGDLGDGFDLDGVQLASDLKRARVAVSTEETRYYLNGIFFHRTADEYGPVMRMAATDGHRLALITRPVPVGMPDDFPDVILPRKTCDVLALVLGKGERDVRCAFSRTKARFRVGRVVIDTKLIDGVFPDYSRVIPQHYDHAATLQADVLRDAAKSVTAAMSGKDRAVLLCWHAGQGWATVSAYCPESGPAMMTLEGGTFENKLAIDGEDFGVGMNARLLAELLAQWPGDVTIRIVAPDHPMRLESPDAPEYLQVLMPMRMDGALVTPASIAKLQRNPLETFNDEAPKLVADLADVATSDAVSPSGRRSVARVIAKQLAELVQGAIGHWMTQGHTRQEARRLVLMKLASLRGDADTLYRLAEEHNRAKDGARSSFRAWSEGIGRVVQDPVPVAGGEEAEPVQPDAPAPAPLPAPAEAEPVPAELEPVPVDVNENAEMSDAGNSMASHVVILPVGKPLYRSLQDFKAMTGVGTRWMLANWDSRAGCWGEDRLVTVATVKARSLGFVRGAATPMDVAAANACAGHEGRTWLDFPKQGRWQSTEDALVILYSDGSPCMLVRHAGVPWADLAGEEAEAAAPVLDPVEGQPDVVAELSERLARLERLLEGRAGEVGQPGAEEPERAAAPESGQNSGNLDETYRNLGQNEKQRAIGYLDGRSARERDPAFVGGVDIAYHAGFHDGRKCAESGPMVHYDDYQAMLARAEAAEAALADSQAEVQRLANMAASLRHRTERQAAVLTGRKAQLARRGDELRFAHGKAAQLQRELSAERGQPVIILPGDTIAA